ncbi:MAG: type II toxin-antitoxin system VapB family antitoxin [Geodermatophilaceae bacterium]|nr:type II toxin-antitoxin system VapB family antitoxin [Geodermatophilaceae bacterium]
MRMHIELDDQLVAEIDELAGQRGRSAFVRNAIERAIQAQRRWEHLDTAAGSISDDGHDWDPDPAEWVRHQRRGDSRRGG